MSDYFIKKLRLNELGYVGGVPGKRGGQHFYISKNYLDFFPPLSKKIPQHLKILNIVRHNHNLPAQAKYVYDNDKYHGGHPKNPRNERRININLNINPERKIFLKNDIIIFKKEIFKNEDNDDEDAYVITRYRESIDKRDYDYLNNLLKLRALDKRSTGYCSVEKEDLLSLENYKSRLFEKVLPEGPIMTIVDREIATSITDGQRQGSLEKSQEDQVKRLILDLYNHRCCITNIGFIWEDFSKPKQEKYLASSHKGVEAAHIKPRKKGGPYTFQNIIPLIAPVHKLFDRGIFTINNESKIEIHPEALKQRSLNNFHNFNQKVLNIPDNIQLSADFLKWHRDNLYGAFLTGDRIKNL